MNRILGLATAIGCLFISGEATARHLTIDDCIQVRVHGELKWYCPITKCHYVVPKKKVQMPLGNDNNGNNNTIIINPDDPNNPPPDDGKPDKDKDDNGHGNDPGKVDPSNPGKSKK